MLSNFCAEKCADVAPAALGGSDHVSAGLVPMVSKWCWVFAAVFS